MTLAHLTLPTQEVERTAAFLEATLEFRRGAIPGNSPVPTQWLDMGGGQQIHIVFVRGYAASAFEGEFGRHIAVTYPRDGFDGLKARLEARGAEVMTPLRATSFERFFFREPVNGYVFEVIASS
jgi:catechol 2,3-dioxygenase-like lactoylglutathione lyase family enzyme